VYHMPYKGNEGSASTLTQKEQAVIRYT
jgi:hypothetical protein